jgi:methyl-accepting chemotaxis protein
MAGHSDVLLVIIYVLGFALVGTLVFLFKVLWGKQKQNSEAIKELGLHMAKLNERVDVNEKDVTTALQKSEQIEKNYVKKFDELRLGIEQLASTLNKTLMEGITELKVEMEKTKAANEKYFLNKDEYSKMHDKIERMIEKLTEKVNED